MTPTALNSMLRNTTLHDIIDFISTKYNVDALSISSSSIVYPVVDQEGNEKYIKISVSVPRGTRDGKGGYEDFDGYAVAEDYKLECAEKAAKKAASEAKKAAKIKADQQKREAKKVIKELNEKGLKKVIEEKE